MNNNRRPRTLAATRRVPSLWWLLAAAALAVACAGLVKPAAAQSAADAKILSSDELADVVGPIALYPDDLIGIVLPASTYPLQIVEAARFLDKRKSDPSLKPNEDWDDSVLALLNYPEVVHLLNDDLDWTWDLGTAVLNQRDDVLDAIQAFRQRASDAGNLRTDNRQTVTKQTDGAIAIAPVDPEVIYVPYYEPERVVVYQSAPVYFYYPWGYPVYYYPYPADYVFNTGFFWGVTSFFSIGWHSHLLYEHYYGHYDHPYYGRTYYRPFYVRNYFNGGAYAGRADHVWQPRQRYGDRPIVRGREGRVVDSRPEPRVSHGVAGSASRTYRDGGAATRAGGGVATRGPVATAPRSGHGVGSVAGTERRTSPTSRPPTSPTEGVRTSRQSTAPGGSNGSYRVGGGMARASEQNRLNYYQGNVARTPSTPTTRSAPPTFRAPETRSPAPTYRGPQTRSAPSFTAPAARAPAVRSTLQRSAPVSRAPARSSSGPSSYRGGGGSAFRGSSGSHGGRSQGHSSRSR